MTDDKKTFLIDNQMMENAPTVFGKNNAIQLQLPGLETLGPFDRWTMLGCYSLLDPKAPTAPVRITLSEFIDLLDFVKTIVQREDGYEWQTFASDDFIRVKESLHRLFSIEVVIRGDWMAGRDRQGRRKREVIESHVRILTSYSYIYAPDVIPPDQLPDSKRRNVNKVRTPKGEAGPPIYELLDGPRPIAVEFRFSEELVRGLTRSGANIGATTVPRRIFELRRQIPSRDTTTVNLLQWTARQTKQSPKIKLDKLVAKVNLDPRQPSRNRETVLRSLHLLKKFGVIDDFSHNQTTDQVVLKKAASWHFPRRQGEIED